MRAPQGFEPVPSWAVTSAMLGAWGFPVEVRDKVCGMHFVAVPGMPRHEALHAAWAAGFVNVSPCLPEAEKARRKVLKAEKAARQAENMAESVAWAMAVRRGPEAFARV